MNKFQINFEVLEFQNIRRLRQVRGSNMQNACFQNGKSREYYFKLAVLIATLSKKLNIIELFRINIY